MSEPALNIEGFDPKNPAHVAQLKKAWNRFAKEGEEASVRTIVRMEVKGLNETKRSFDGLLSTWERDLGDDVIHPGAFKDSLQEWRSGEAEMPMFYGHNYKELGALIGHFPDYRETKTGLWVQGELLEDQHGEAALLRLRKKLINGMSIGYNVVKYDLEDSDEARFGVLRNLYKLKLNEGSLVPFPMNTGSRVNLASVKDLSREQLMQFKAAVDEALQAPEDGTGPAPEPPQPTKEAEPAPPTETEEPDFSAFARLQLRRLARSPNARKEA